MNAEDFTRLYRRTRGGTGVTGDLVRLEFNQIRANVMRTLTHVTVENKTSAYTKCRLGIKDGDRDHYIDEHSDIAAEELLVSRSDIRQRENDVFFVELTGTTTGDELVVTCIGWELDL